MLDNISVVLVGTLKSGNVGAAARAMKNMGLTRLKLAAPCEDIDEAARMMAAGAHDILESAQIFPDLDQALHDEQVIVGTTSLRERRQTRNLLTPAQAAEPIRSMAEKQRVALLFGPERGGLDDAQLARCSHLITIPAHSNHPVLNVAQSVLVVAYEIFQAQGGQPLPLPPDLATDGEKQQMFEHLQWTLLRIGFIGPQNQDHMMKAFHQLLGGALTRRDANIVRGLMSHMQWFAESGACLPEEQVRKP